MKPILLILLVLATSILWPADLSFGVCPEAPNDDGLCDTMYVEVYPSDVGFTGPGQLVRVPIYVTNDTPNPIDSIDVMVIPLCYTHTNPAKYCSLSYHWNLPYPNEPTNSRSIFRNLDDTTHNRFLEMYSNEPMNFWDIDFEVDISPAEQYFGFAWQGSWTLWREGSHGLALTMTFRVQDTMTVCIDSCFWPRSDRLAFETWEAVPYIPRHNLPYCFSISFRVGDITKDGRVDMGDIVYLIGYLYRAGPAPNPLSLGDANCDGSDNLEDVIFLINYVFRGGPAPSCE
jgi:hypothetical protein